MRKWLDIGNASERVSPPMTPNTLDITGRVFGELTVVSRHGSIGKRASWRCLCSCGKTKIASGVLLRAGRVKSCGHLNGDGRSKLLAYATWRRMKERCYNPKHDRYPEYGGRGVTVCERWRDSFPNFLADMGDRPGLEYSIDRRDPNGHYEPGNCRWAIDADQRINKRNSRYVTYQGRLRLLIELCRELGKDYGTIACRVYVLEWPVDKALEIPIRPYRKAQLS
jgi:hypothetical protein